MIGFDGEGMMLPLLFLTCAVVVGVVSAAMPAPAGNTGDPSVVMASKVGEPEAKGPSVMPFVGSDGTAGEAHHLSRKPSHWRKIRLCEASRSLETVDGQLGPQKSSWEGSGSRPAAFPSGRRAGEETFAFADRPALLRYQADARNAVTEAIAATVRT